MQEINEHNTQMEESVPISVPENTGNVTINTNDMNPRAAAEPEDTSSSASSCPFEQVTTHTVHTNGQPSNGPADQEQHNVWVAQQQEGEGNEEIGSLNEEPMNIDSHAAAEPEQTLNESVPIQTNFHTTQNLSSSESTSQEIQKIIHYIKTSLSEEDLQEFSDKCCAVDSMANGDGSGLGGGFLIDKFTIDFFIGRLEYCEECHEGESDLMILGMLLSLKKIMGQSTIALDWSKNPEASSRKRFTNHIMIINLKTEKWWKKGPKEPVNTIDYTLNIVKGIYFVDKKFCRQNITLSSNNKTYTLVKPQYLYTMLHRSIQQGWFIELPEIKRNYEAYLAFK